MKILLVQNTDYIKRNPGQQHHLSELISLRGHEIRVIDFEILWKSEGRREFKSKREIFRGVSKIHKGVEVTVIRPGIVKIPFLDYLSLFYSQKKEIERQIREFKPDIILSLGIVAYLAGKAAKKHDIPFVYYWIDVSHRLIPAKFLHPLGRIMEKIALKKADKVLTINYRLKDYVINLGSTPEETKVIGAGVNLENFDPSISGSAVKAEYGINDDDIVVFFMGWLYQFSGLKEVAIELSKVKKDYTHLKLLIVGDGDAYNEIRDIKEKFGLNNQLILTGKVPYEKIPEFIASSDVCILPAYPDEKIMKEIVPIKIYEYMAMKKPVVTTPLKGIMGEFGNNNGILYANKPEDVLKIAIKLIKNNKAEFEGNKARKLVENYNWNCIADEFEGVLNEVQQKSK
ncbi:glycosyltransferase [Methanobacterium sp.]|jgi:glycosyltransferase involved in cell wall biosynthesis|uniref:glycosyltransferase n=1 Tax=Methanobacterium sp. TaxID=2164 RepID=UPI0031591837